MTYKTFERIKMQQQLSKEQNFPSQEKRQKKKRGRRNRTKHLTSSYSAM